MKIIEAFEVWMFRKSAKISWKDEIQNKEVMERLGVEGVASNIKEGENKIF